MLVYSIRYPGATERVRDHRGREENCELALPSPEGYWSSALRRSASSLLMDPPQRQCGRTNMDHRAE